MILTESKMNQDLSIDIWDDTGCLKECIDSYKSGRSLMLKYRREGKQNLRMYVRVNDRPERNKYYKFNGKGNLIGESDYGDN